MAAAGAYLLEYNMEDYNEVGMAKTWKIVVPTIGYINSRLMMLHCFMKNYDLIKPLTSLIIIYYH